MSIKLTKTLLAVTAGTMVTASAFATNFTVSGTVSNAITLTETTPLSLGTVFIKSASTIGSGPSLTIATDGVTTPATNLNGGNGNIVSLSGATAGVLTVSGAATFTQLAVTTNVAPIQMALVGGAPSLPKISFLPAVNTLTPTTNGAGVVDIIVGGVFTAPATASATLYQDGSYTGTYSVNVSY